MDRRLRNHVLARDDHRCRIYEDGARCPVTDRVGTVYLRRPATYDPPVSCLITVCDDHALEIEALMSLHWNR